MPTITSKHLDIAKRAARRFARGPMSSHYDDFVGVANLCLVEMWAAGKDMSRDSFVASDCRIALINYLRDRKSGRINGSFPVSLDSFPLSSAEAIVNKSMDDFGCTFRTSKPRTVIVENIGKGRGCASKGKTHCKRNHEFTEANTYRRGTRRECIACRAFNESRLRGKKMAA